MSNLQIVEATTAQHIEAARKLFQEYAASLNFELCFQNFEAELALLPGAYASPEGCLLLAHVEEAIAGCVALRPLAPGLCEMKRLYVREVWRGLGVGHALGEAIVQRGKTLGYNSMRLDTVATMQEAIGLYEKLGFREIEAYYPNPLKDVRYFELVW